MKKKFEWVVDNTLGRVPLHIRERMNTWQFWITAFGVFLGFVVAGLAATAVVAIRNERTTLRERAARIAAVERDNAQKNNTINTAFQQCIASIPLLGSFNEFILGENELAQTVYNVAATQVENAARTIAAAPPDDPLMPARRVNLGELLNARSDAALAMARVSAFNPFPVPSEAKCIARRNFQRSLAGIPTAKKKPKKGGHG